MYRVRDTTACLNFKNPSSDLNWPVMFYSRNGRGIEPSFVDCRAGPSGLGLGESETRAIRQGPKPLSCSPSLQSRHVCPHRIGESKAKVKVSRRESDELRAGNHLSIVSRKRVFIAFGVPAERRGHLKGERIPPPAPCNALNAIGPGRKTFRSWLMIRYVQRGTQ